MLRYNYHGRIWSCILYEVGAYMKNLNLIVWLTQLGLSVVAPLAIWILLAVWLQNRLQWGDWVIVAGVVLGIICAASGLRSSLKLMESMAKGKKEEKEPLAFNDHE